MNPDIENAVLGRIGDKLEATAPGFDPMILTVLIEFLMNMLSGMCEQLTPEQAVDRIPKMTAFQKAALRSRLTSYARTRGVNDAKHLAPKAADACQQVAAEATPEERLAFAKYLKPMTEEQFDLF